MGERCAKIRAEYFVFCCFGAILPTTTVLSFEAEYPMSQGNRQSSSEQSQEPSQYVPPGKVEDMRHYTE